jgi:hypothetical protein
MEGFEKPGVLEKVTGQVDEEILGTFAQSMPKDPLRLLDDQSGSFVCWSTLPRLITGYTKQDD